MKQLKSSQRFVTCNQIKIMSTQVKETFICLAFWGPWRNELQLKDMRFQGAVLLHLTVCVQSPGPHGVFTRRLSGKLDPSEIIWVVMVMEAREMEQSDVFQIFIMFCESLWQKKQKGNFCLYSSNFSSRKQLIKKCNQNY